jgi:hypothetical protein
MTATSQNSFSAFLIKQWALFFHFKRPSLPINNYYLELIVPCKYEQQSSDAEEARRREAEDEQPRREKAEQQVERS